MQYHEGVTYFFILSDLPQARQPTTHQPLQNTSISLPRRIDSINMNAFGCSKRTGRFCSLVRRRISYQHWHSRQFHTTRSLPTDGVYNALTEMRVKTPWIEALKKQRQQGIDPTSKSDTPATPANRDLTPKKMSDSFHRVVRRASVSNKQTSD